MEQRGTPERFVLGGAVLATRAWSLRGSCHMLSGTWATQRMAWSARESPGSASTAVVLLQRTRRGRQKRRAAARGRGPAPAAEGAPRQRGRQTRRRRAARRRAGAPSGDRRRQQRAASVARRQARRRAAGSGHGGGGGLRLNTKRSGRWRGAGTHAEAAAHAVVARPRRVECRGCWRESLRNWPAQRVVQLLGGVLVSCSSLASLPGFDTTCVSSLACLGAKRLKLLFNNSVLPALTHMHTQHSGSGGWRGAAEQAAKCLAGVCMHLLAMLGEPPERVDSLSTW